ncbi:MAG: molybdopterin-dependent oxidoreductase [Roseiflexaceae bacterium]
MTAANDIRTHYRTCNLCEAMCGLEIKVRGQEILSIKGDRDDPFSQGHICPKAVALQDIYHDPDRLKFPMRRTAAGWEQIGWDEAFDEVATNLRAVQERHGANAVGVYLGNPVVHNMGTLLFAAPFIRALRTRNRFSATSVDQLPHHFAAYHMLGHQLLLPIPDIDRTDFLLILGANPLASNGSLMSAPGVARRLRAIQERGGKVVLIDPRRTETAAAADQHYFIQPGADALLLLALLHTIFADGLATSGRLAALCNGLDTIAALVAGFPPERVAGATGIAPAEIRRLAHDFATAATAVCYGRVGASTQAFGGLAQWLINVLNIVTGNFDRPGGAMFPKAAFDVVGITSATGQVGHSGRWCSRVRGLAEFGGELPVATMAEEILAEGTGQIKALVTIAGNPVLSTPNGGRLDQALAGLEFMVAIDIYINETTRHANIILPPTTGLETDHYDISFHTLAVRNTAKYSPALFAPAPGMQHDWQILLELRRRLGGLPADTSNRHDPRVKLDVFSRMSPDKIVDLALRFGPYGYWGGNQHGHALSLRKLKRSPHGVDLGPLQACLPERLMTQPRRIELAPAALLQDVPRLERTLLDETTANRIYDLSLIGRRQLRSNNSWMHNSVRLVRGKQRCTLLINPQDAAMRGLQHNQQVCVRSRAGQIELPIEISDEMMPGVVSIPHGWGHNRLGVQLATAQQHAGASVNDLTDEQLIDELTGNAAFSGVPVSVQASV